MYQSFLMSFSFINPADLNIQSPVELGVTFPKEPPMACSRNNYQELPKHEGFQTL